MVMVMLLNDDLRRWRRNEALSVNNGWRRWSMNEKTHCWKSRSWDERHGWPHRYAWK